MVSLASGRLTGRRRDLRELSRPLYTFDVGWADQPGVIEMTFSPNCNTDSPPASPIRGTEPMRLLMGSARRTGDPHRAHDPCRLGEVQPAAYHPRPGIDLIPPERRERQGASLCPSVG